MPDFTNIDQIKNAARGALINSPDVATAKRRIRALPGPMRGPIPEGATGPSGMYFDIPGDIIVRFNADGSRDAIFVITTQPDDPNPENVNIHWMPEQTHGQARPSRRRMVAGRRADTITRLI